MISNKSVRRQAGLICQGILPISLSARPAPARTLNEAKKHCHVRQPSSTPTGLSWRNRKKLWISCGKRTSSPNSALAVLFCLNDFKNKCCFLILPPKQTLLPKQNFAKLGSRNPVFYAANLLHPHLAGGPGVILFLFRDLAHYPTLQFARAVMVSSIDLFSFCGDRGPRHCRCLAATNAESGEYVAEPRHMCRPPCGSVRSLIPANSEFLY